MRKKLTSALLSACLMASLFVSSVSAAGFSEDNYTQYMRGFYTSSSDMQITTETTEVGGEEYVTYAKANGASTKTLTSDRNPIAYKNPDVNDGPAAKYAHMRLYFTAFSDQYRNSMKYINLRIDKDGTGSSRDWFVLDGGCDGVYPRYASTAGNSNAFHDAYDNVGIWTMGKDYNTNSNDRVPDDEDYHKLDIVTDLKGVKSPVNYLYVDNQYVGCYYDTGLSTDHFYGIVFRINKGKTLRANCYMSAKFDADRIGHREYYDTEDYKVCFEDVLQDAGIGIASEDESVMYQTDILQNYMPSSSKRMRYYDETEGAAVLLNQDTVNFEGSTAYITTGQEGTVEDYVKVADMLAGTIPQRSGFGLGYVGYKARANLIRISFDQTISDSSTWLDYEIANSGYQKVMQFWNNDGKLVVWAGGGVMGTTDADFEGTNRIDLVIEPSTQANYIFVNGKLAQKAHNGLERIQNMILKMKGTNSAVMIDNWSLTMYNSLKDVDELSAEICDRVAYWPSNENNNGIVLDAENNRIQVLSTAKIRAGVEVPEGLADAKIITALYDENDQFIDMQINNFNDGVTIGDETEDNIFVLSSYSLTVSYAKSFLLTPDSLIPWTTYKAVAMPSAE